MSQIDTATTPKKLSIQRYFDAADRLTEGRQFCFERGKSLSRIVQRALKVLNLRPHLGEFAVQQAQVQPFGNVHGHPLSHKSTCRGHLGSEQSGGYCNDCPVLNAVNKCIPNQKGAPGIAHPCPLPATKPPIHDIGRGNVTPTGSPGCEAFTPYLGVHKWHGERSGCTWK